MLLIIGGVSLISSTECSNSNISDEEANQVSNSIGYCHCYYDCTPCL